MHACCVVPLFELPTHTTGPFRDWSRIVFPSPVSYSHGKACVLLLYLFIPLPFTSQLGSAGAFLERWQCPVQSAECLHWVPVQRTCFWSLLFFTNSFHCSFALVYGCGFVGASVVSALTPLLQQLPLPFTPPCLCTFVRCCISELIKVLYIVVFFRD